jgi:hypothetical protein
MLARHSFEFPDSCSPGLFSPCTLATQPPENDFAFANDPITERCRGWSGYLAPFYVLHVSATVAYEVMMRHSFCVKPCGTALHGDLAHQTCFNQISQIVISGGPGRTRIDAIHSFKNFRSCGMTFRFHQKRHHGVTLWSTPQAPALKGPLNLRGIHYLFGIYLM